MNMTTVLPEGAKELLLDWTEPDVALIHVWESEGTYYVVQDSERSIRCSRLFQLGGSWHISIDREMRK